MLFICHRQKKDEFWGQLDSWGIWGKDCRTDDGLQVLSSGGDVGDKEKKEPLLFRNQQSNVSRLAGLLLVYAVMCSALIYAQASSVALRILRYKAG